MSKPKRKRKRPGGHHTATRPTDEQIAGELQQRVTELQSIDPDQAGALWGAIHKLLLKTTCDRAAVGRIIVGRDSDALTTLVGALERGDPVSLDEPKQEAPPTIEIPYETRKMAMRAFRKRIKLTRLDHESKLGVGPMSSGRKADVDAILPPHEYAREVWDALVAEGQLKSAGQGFYALAEE